MKDQPMKEPGSREAVGGLSATADGGNDPFQQYRTAERLRPARGSDPIERVAQVGVTDGRGNQTDQADSPPPSTWKYDARGNLTEAGNRFSAAYDTNGNLMSVIMKNDIFIRTKADEVERVSYSQARRRLEKETFHNVTSFTATQDTYQSPSAGGYPAIESFWVGVKVNTPPGSHSGSVSEIIYQRSLQ